MSTRPKISLPAKKAGSSTTQKLRAPVRGFGSAPRDRRPRPPAPEADGSPTPAPESGSRHRPAPPVETREAQRRDRPPARDAQRRPPERDERRSAPRDERRPPQRQDERRPFPGEERRPQWQDRRAGPQDDRRPPQRHDERRPFPGEERRLQWQDRRTGPQDDRRPPQRHDERRPFSGDDRRPQWQDRRAGPQGNEPRQHRDDARRGPASGDRDRAFGPRHQEPGRPQPRRDMPPAPAERPSRRFGPDAPPLASQAENAGAPPEGIRLSKRMSELGLASRREADEWIGQGWVLVDGEIVSELGSRVRPEQQITIDPQARQQQAQRVTVLINKPIGFVSGQAEDGYEPAVVLVKRENQWSGDRSGLKLAPGHLRHLAPAGRLDIDSTGLLVLTQDGRVARALIGEDSDIEKEYLVRVRWADPGRAQEVPLSQTFPPEKLELLRHGLSLDGEALKPARVSWQNEEQLRFVLREGKKRQIRRMCEQVGLEVIGLKRIRMGRIVLGDLPAGQWRFLRADERF